MLLGNMLLALAWAALQGEFSLGTLVTGQVLGYLILLGREPHARQWLKEGLRVEGGEVAQFARP